MKKILITGITGYIGGSVAKLLLAKDYEVYGLVRKTEDVFKVEQFGAKAVVGNINDYKLLCDICRDADVIIHTAESADDAYAATNFLKILEGTGKTFVFTSGSAILGGKENGEISDFQFTEDIPLSPRLEMSLRVNINKAVLQAAQKKIRSIVIVPTMVYGEGIGLKKESIQIPALVKISMKKGRGVYIEKGDNIWSNLHIEDLAELYVLAIEKAKSGALYYAENGASSIKEIANTISERYKLEQPESISIDEAIQHFGEAGAHFGFASNSYCNADKAKAELGWKPKFNNIHEYI
ncbi:NAD-dependent epimerase/dehydratase family protein [Elizabethkingia sp. HX XZB]|uniref:NAD-dependent epimerase/dehydratase family protein n=1 Tax=Elizabethkingia TaxID=308865 RepID=UPI00209FAB8C|nr:MULTISPECIES: NAD-dependent epimerase/dehydratase family protein [unclassified Elizabethkingia]MCP1252989.1 NAD-dependent epimerase/dehydratase family protein [Elizabethkingia sp. S0634]MDX8569948.1 NAD-dependent epimerase/dehydratase family protein [Elizabethkingia sp. HX XZB]